MEGCDDGDCGGAVRECCDNGNSRGRVVMLVIVKRVQWR